MRTMAHQITSLTIIYSTVYLGANQRKYQSSASLAFMGGIHRWPVNSPHKRPVTRKMFPFDDVIIAVACVSLLAASRGLACRGTALCLWEQGLLRGDTAGLLSVGPLGSNFSEILIKIGNFSFTKIHLKMSSATWWPFCPGGGGGGVS